MNKIATLPAVALCMLNTWDTGIDVRLTPGRDGIELQKDDVKCVIPLDCKVQGQPTNIDYDLATLARGKVSPQFHQVRRVTFKFADGGVQSCGTEGAKAVETTK
jgi:hypothetical protein